METQVTTPIVIRAPSRVGHIGWILDDRPLMEPTRHIARAEMHLANVHTPVPVIGQILHPVTMLGPAIKRIDSCDISVFIPKVVDVDEVAKVLTKSMFEKLEGKLVALDNLHAGVQVQIEKKNMRIDVSDEALLDLVARFIRKEFRNLLFG